MGTYIGPTGPTPGGGNGGPTILPDDDYYQSDEYWDYVLSTVQGLVLQSNPGVKDYTTMNPTQRFSHILSHVMKSKEQGVNFKISDIMTNISNIAPRGLFLLQGGIRKVAMHD